MIENKRTVLRCLTGMLLALSLSACEFSVSTSGMGSVSASKEKSGGTPTTTFSVADKIFVTAVTKNVSSGTKVKWRTYATKVEGVPENTPITNFDYMLDMPSGATTAEYNLTPTPEGWPVGNYKIEATMLIEGGKQQEQKSIDITIKAAE